MPLLLRDLTLLALRLDRILPGTIDGPVADAALHRHVVDEPRPDPRTLLSQADRLALDDQTLIDEIPYDFVRKRLSIVIAAKNADATQL